MAQTGFDIWRDIWTLRIAIYGAVVSTLSIVVAGLIAWSQYQKDKRQLQKDIRQLQIEAILTTWNDAVIISVSNTGFRPVTINEVILTFYPKKGGFGFKELENLTTENKYLPIKLEDGEGFTMLSSPILDFLRELYGETTNLKDEDMRCVVTEATGNHEERIRIVGPLKEPPPRLTD